MISPRGGVKDMMRRFLRNLVVGLVAITIAMAAPFPAAANAPRLSFIRDAESEALLRDMLRFLVDDSILDEQSIRLFIVQDPRLNAFVTNGQNIFFNTGLLQKVETPEQLLGIMAHELGHIMGGHLARLYNAAEDLSAVAIATQVLGAAAAIASGNPALGGAIGLGGQQLAARSFFSFTRTQESAADQFALGLLAEKQVSARGLQSFFKILEKQELWSPTQQDPYLRTHPLTQDRLMAINHFVEQENAARKLDEFDYRLKRMQGKLDGFLLAPLEVYRRYNKDDVSLRARFARMVAFYREGQIDKALVALDELQKEDPRNPFDYDLRGQILFENQKLNESIAAYRYAHRLAPQQSLIQVSLAQALLATDNPKDTDEALTLLEQATKTDRYHSLAWRLLAVAYGREDNIGMAALSLAERASLGRDKVEAMQQAKRASHYLTKGSEGWLRAQDILLAFKREEDDN